MPLAGRRSRLEIYADILRTVQAEASAGRDTNVTRIQLAVRVPFNRFQFYVDDLAERRLLVKGSSLHITKEGEGFLRQYATMIRFMDQFGFSQELE